MTKVTLRYWASARAAAGRAEETFESDTLGELLAAALRAHGTGSRLAGVLSVASFVVDEHPVGLRAPDEVRLFEGSVVEVLPPFAGGCDPDRRTQPREHVTSPEA